jgi:hypothetical protein
MSGSSAMIATRQSKQTSISHSTKPDGSIKLDNLNRAFEEQKVRVEGAPNWQGNVKPGTCRKIIAKVMVDRCKATFDSELVIKYPGRNGARCSEVQKSGDWILRRCLDIFTTVECLAGNGLTCDEAFDKIGEKPTFEARRAEFERVFCSDRSVKYVYKICFKKFAMRLKLTGQRPTRAVLRDDDGKFDEVNQRYPKTLPIFSGGEP